MSNKNIDTKWIFLQFVHFILIIFLSPAGLSSLAEGFVCACVPQLLAGSALTAEDLCKSHGVQSLWLSVSLKEKKPILKDMKNNATKTDYDTCFFFILGSWDLDSKLVELKVDTFA